MFKRNPSPVIDFSEESRGPDKPVAGKLYNRRVDDFLVPPVESLMKQPKQSEKPPYTPKNEREMEAFWDFVLVVAVLVGLWGVVTVGIGAVLWSALPIPWWNAVAAGMVPAFIVLWIVMDQHK